MSINKGVANAVGIPHEEMLARVPNHFCSCACACAGFMLRSEFAIALIMIGGLELVVVMGVEL